MECSAFLMRYLIVIIGTGLSGATCARSLAEEGCSVVLLEKRNHFAGNAFDRCDDAGIRVHDYGPHLFHTNSDRVLEFLSRLTTWQFYEHRVLASVDGMLVPMPINRSTINQFYGSSLDDAGIERFIEQQRIPRSPIETSEDHLWNSIGPDLCDKFFRGYSRKQWGLDLSELSASVAARIPFRTNDDDRYFTDKYQFMPTDGYTAMIANMLDHPNIEVQLETDFFDIRDSLRYDHLIYTGPIDQFFDYRFGPLPYRSLRFEHVHIPDCERFQPAAQINYPNDFDYTRVTEFKQITGQTHSGTSIVREYPQATGEPYYPIPRRENEELCQLYRAEAAKLDNVSFVGRLAQYRYYNMDQAVAAALKLSDQLIARYR